MHKEKVETFKYGVLPFIILSCMCAVIMLKQPDIGTFLVIFSALFTMFIVAGAKWRHIGLILLCAVAAIALVTFLKPYAMARVTTFLNPEANSQGSGYQIQQALIAVGSGKMFGRGFGQSIQKFNFLPEPVGDSIFAVAAEEFGFLGTVILVGIFTFFTLRGLRIASKAKESFTEIVLSISSRAENTKRTS